MATASDVLRVAAGEIGYSRWSDPQEGTKYGRWYAAQTGEPYFGASGVSYCAMFVSWVLAQVGVKFLYAYCPYIVRDFAAEAVGKAEARPGDIVLFDWDGDGEADHVGFVELNRGSYYQTIEGNTSSGASGSQGNGGVVARRTRSVSLVCAVIHLDYGESEDEVNDADKNDIAQRAADKVVNYMLNGTLLRDRIIGTDTAANDIVRTVADRVWGADLNGTKARDRLIGLDSIQVPELRATVAAQGAAIEALSKAQGADPGAVAKAVSDAVAAKLASIDLKVTTEG